MTVVEYAKVEDGRVLEVTTEPDSWENADGSWTSTPADTPTSPKELRKAGFLPVEEVIPEFDPETHVAGPGRTYEVSGSKVVATAEITPLPVNEVALLRAEVQDLAAQIAELRESVAQVQPPAAT